MTVLLVVAAFCCGALAGWALTTAKRRRRSPPSSAAGESAGDPAPLSERGILIEALIQLADVTASDALAAQIDRALRRVRVEPFTGDGVRFDPEIHHAVETEPTSDPSLRDLVAETVRRGYSDGDVLLREADVVVYTGD